MNRGDGAVDPPPSPPPSGGPQGGGEGKGMGFNPHSTCSCPITHIKLVPGWNKWSIGYWLVTKNVVKYRLYNSLKKMGIPLHRNIGHTYINKHVLFTWYHSKKSTTSLKERDIAFKCFFPRFALALFASGKQHLAVNGALKKEHGIHEREKHHRKTNGCSIWKKIMKHLKKSE